MSPHPQISGVKIADRESVNDWVLKREGTIGSSSISGCYPGKDGMRIGYDTPVDLFQKLRGYVSDREPNNAMLTGVVMQPSVEHFVMQSKYFQELNATRIPEASEVLFKHRLNSRLTATPDMVIEIDSPQGGREAVIVEIKTTSRIGNWRVRTTPGDKTIWRVPQRVFLQLQHQLDVLGLRTGYIACYPLSQRTVDMDGPVWISSPVTINDDIIAENHRWANAMLTCCDAGVSPVLADSYKGHKPEDIGDAEALRRLRRDKAVEATPDVLNKVARASHLKSSKSDVGGEYKALSEEIKMAFGLATEMVNDDGDVIAKFTGGDVLDETKFAETLAYHKIETDGLDIEKLVLAYPGFAKESVTSAKSRRLWIK